MDLVKLTATNHWWNTNPRWPDGLRRAAWKTTSICVPFLTAKSPHEVF